MQVGVLSRVTQPYQTVYTNAQEVVIKLTAPTWNTNVLRNVKEDVKLASILARVTLYVFLSYAWSLILLFHILLCFYFMIKGQFTLCSTQSISL